MPTDCEPGFNCYNFSTVRTAQFSVANPVRFELGGQGNTATGPETSAMKCPFCGFANDKVVDSARSKKRSRFAAAASV